MSIAAIMPVDRDESDWGDLQIIFATSDGGVRRNALSDFTNVRANGKIAMKLPAGVELVNARIASEGDDIMLVTNSGRAIRFPTTDLRIYKGRGSTGVRGIKLSGDRVVSMAILPHFEATPNERAAYLKLRRAAAGVPEEGEEDQTNPTTLSQARYAEMAAAENLILTITRRGAGKLSSSHDYPVQSRGGMGVTAIEKPCAAGILSPAFPWNCTIRSCW